MGGIERRARLASEEKDWRNSGGLESDCLDEIVQGGCDSQIKLVQAGDLVDWKRCVSGKRIENSG
jgi:hypothetical protein